LLLEPLITDGLLLYAWSVIMDHCNTQYLTVEHSTALIVLQLHKQFTIRYDTICKYSTCNQKKTDGQPS